MDDDDVISEIPRKVQIIGVLVALVYSNMHNEIAVVKRVAALYVGVSIFGSILAILVYKHFYSEE